MTIIFHVIVINYSYNKLKRKAGPQYIVNRINLNTIYAILIFLIIPQSNNCSEVFILI